MGDVYNKDVPAITKSLEQHEKARTTMLGISTGTVAAATTYKSHNRTLPSAGRPNQTHKAGAPPQGDQKCACGNWYLRFIMENGSQNKQPYTCCKSCHLSEKKSEK